MMAFVQWLARLFWWPRRRLLTTYSRTQRTDREELLMAIQLLSGTVPTSGPIMTWNQFNLLLRQRGEYIAAALAVLESLRKHLEAERACPECGVVNRPEDTNS